MDGWMGERVQFRVPPCNLPFIRLFFLSYRALIPIMSHGEGYEDFFYLSSSSPLDPSYLIPFPLIIIQRRNLAKKKN